MDLPGGAPSRCPRGPLRNYEVVQLTFFAGTRPSEVGGLNVQVTVNVLDPWVTVTVALVNATSVIVSIQLGLGQSGAPSTVALAKTASTENGAFPFLLMASGVIDS